MSEFTEGNKAEVLALVQELYPTATLDNIVAHKHACDTHLRYRWCYQQERFGALVALGTTRGMVRRYVAEQKALQANGEAH